MDPTAPPIPAQDGVVLLHGIFRTAYSMRTLARALTRAGYRVLNMGYPSTRRDLAALAAHLHPEASAFARTVRQVHFVGYSMGGLVIRAYLARHRPENLGRVVMLGTPNQGSEVADFIRNWRLYRALYGPAGQQLITDQRAFADVLGTVAYPLGVIAGDRTLDPLGSWLLPGPNDGKVSVASTRVAGMHDHRTIHATHTFLCRNREAIRLTLGFLENGRF